MNPVNQIVQQNSSISEENASASEELTARANQMQEMINRFKLKRVPATQQNMYLNVGKSQPKNDEPQPVNGGDHKFKSIATTAKTEKFIMLDDDNFGKY